MVSPIRIGGLASGMDTETMVKQLMQAERAKVDKYSQQKQLKLWQQERYNAFSKTMAGFVIDMKKDLGFIKTTATGALLPGATDNFNWVKKASTVSTNFTASANASATSGSHEIEIKKLAAGVKGASTESIQTVGSNNTIETLLSVSADFKIEVNSKEITITKDDTMTSLAAKIKDSGAGVSASYDVANARFFISTNNTGEASQINIKALDEAGKKLVNDLKLNITSGDGSTHNLTGEESFTGMTFNGQDAVVNFDGATDLKFASNTIVVNGFNITLKNAAPGVKENISVETDVNGIYDKIKNFVDKYNELIDSFNGALKEKQYRDYKPLTDEQKKEMKETDIKLWEEKAKSGLLRGDEVFSRVTDKLRSGLYEQVREISTIDAQTSSPVGTAVGSLYELGITTGSYKDKGKLTIDESKLKQMISEDPEKVMNTLFKTSDIEEVKKPTTAEQKQQMANRRADSGVFVRIFDDMAVGLSEVVLKAGPGKEESLLRSVKISIMTDYVVKGSKSDIDKFLDDVNKSIDNENKRLSLKESSYWSKFSRMEKLMSQMQSQSGWIAQQLGTK